MVYKNLVRLKNMMMLLSFVVIMSIADQSAAVFSYNHSEDKINLYEIEDGIYLGDAKIDDVYVKVEIKINDGKFEEIYITEHCSNFNEAAEVIVYDMLNYQTYDVDLIPGAPTSSKVIIEAVYDALNQTLIN